MFGNFSDNGCSDAELVDEHLQDEWLGFWGTATIRDEEMFVFEYLDDDLFELYEPARLAEMLFCGLVMVEFSRTYRGGTIACFTQHRTLMPRRKAMEMASAQS